MNDSLTLFILLATKARIDGCIRKLQHSSQILKHLCDFVLSQCSSWVLQSSQCSKIRVAQHLGRKGAHLSENKGVKSGCKKFGGN